MRSPSGTSGYQRDAYGHIAREFDIDPNDANAVNEALGGRLPATRHCDADIATIDDPAIAITAIKAHRAIERVRRTPKSLVEGTGSSSEGTGQGRRSGAR